MYLVVEGEETDSNQNAAQQGATDRASGNSVAEGLSNLCPGGLAEGKHKPQNRRRC